MSLTTAQLAALKAAIVGDATLSALWASGNVGGITNYANAVPTTGAASVYRPAIPVDELKNAIVWSDFGALPQGQRDTYVAMTQGTSVDATQASIRAGFMYVFGNAGASFANLGGIAMRSATRFEALYAVAGVTPVFGQQLQISDVNTAMAS